MHESVRNEQHLIDFYNMIHTSSSNPVWASDPKYWSNVTANIEDLLGHQVTWSRTPGTPREMAILLDNALHWSSSPQGFVYWDEVYSRFIRFDSQTGQETKQPEKVYEEFLI